MRRAVIDTWFTYIIKSDVMQEVKLKRIIEILNINQTEGIASFSFQVQQIIKQYPPNRS